MLEQVFGDLSTAAVEAASRTLWWYGNAGSHGEQRLMIGAIIAVTLALSAMAVLAATYRRRQTLIVELALYPEVNSMRFQAAAFAGELARRHVSGNPLDEDFLSTWRLSTPLIYPAAGVQLGYLSPDTLDRVGYFHAQLAEARVRVADAKIRGAETLSTYRLLSNVLRACNYVEPWISSKRSRLGNLTGREADVGEAARLLEDFEIGDKEPLALAYCWADVCAPSDQARK